MQAAIELLKVKLERRLSLVQKATLKNFYLDIKEYVSFIENEPLFSGIISKLNNEIENTSKLYKDNKEIAIAELDKTEAELRQRIRDAGIQDPIIDSYLEEYKNLKNKPLNRSSNLPNSLAIELAKVITELKNKHPEINIKKFEVIEGLSGSIGYITYSKILEYERQNKDISLTERTAPSGAFDRLRMVKNTLDMRVRNAKRTSSEEGRRIENFLRWIRSELLKIVEEDKSENKFFRTPTYAKIDEPESKLVDRLPWLTRENLSNDLIRLHYYIFNELDSHGLELTLLLRFKQMVEWYRREEYKHIINTANKKEHDLELKLCGFLFDKGLFPISQAVFGNQRPDITNFDLGMPTAIEVKVVSDKSISIVKDGFSEILSYISTLEINLGYLVIFNVGNFHVGLEDSYTINDKKISVVIINLREPPSTIKLDVWDISEQDLFGKKGELP